MEVGKLLRFTAGYDLATTFPFAVPGVSAAYLSFWKWIHEASGATGELPALADFHMLYVNMFGLAVAVWALARILKPEPYQCLVDAAARMSYALILGYYLVCTEVSRVLLIFVLPEIILFVLLIAAFRGHTGDRKARG